MEITVRQRLIEYLKYKDIGWNKFEELAGISSGYISHLRNAPKNAQLTKILRCAPDLNRVWLLTGEGSMLTADEEQQQPEADHPILEPSNSTRPRLPVTAAAGPLSEYLGGIRADQCQQIPVIRSMPDYDFTMVVKGDSMEPKFEGGDEIACKEVEHIIEWGREYIVSTNDGAFLKRIYPGDDDRSIRCVSYNPDYPDFLVDKVDILTLYRVVGLLRI